MTPIFTLKARRTGRRRGLAVFLAAGMALAITAKAHADTAAPAADAKPVEHGTYVAILGDCAACHTAPHGRPFSGGLPLESPIGTIYSTNITPDPTTGIGNYSFEDFERAVRHGIRKDGKTLYPAMPYPSYAHISDADMHALYAFFTQAVKPVQAENRVPDIAWPLSMRWPLAWWRGFFAPKVQPAPLQPGTDPVADRGAYLVEGPGHCGTCHTPRGMAFQEKALAPQEGTAYLASSRIDNYIASDLRGDILTGLGNWSEDDIVRFLKAGRNDHTAVFGGMADVVSQSTQHMSDADLHAIAHFLKTLPPTDPNQKFTYDSTVTDELRAGHVTRPGALEYVNNCAACHLTSGKGYVDTFPALAGNPVVNAPDPASLLHIVLIGGSIPGTEVEPTSFTMPPFGARLSDQEVANVVNFIRSSWGNHAPAIDAAQVAKFRKMIAPTPTKKTL